MHENLDVVKTRQFGHFCPFLWAIARSFWLRRRFQRLMTLGTQKLDVVKTRRFCHFWPFLWAIAHSLSLRRRFSTARDPGYMKIGESSKLVDLFISSHFCGLKHTFFWLRRRFQWLVILGTGKLGSRQNSSIRSILAIFVGYSTQFLAPGTISTALDPGYTKIGRRQNLSIWSFLAFLWAIDRKSVV